MIRFATAREANMIARDRLVDLRRDAFPRMNPLPFFKELARSIGVPNDLEFQIEISLACIFYRTLVAGTCGPDDNKEAKRLVRLMRREVSAIDSLRRQYLDLAAPHKDKTAAALMDLNREIQQPFWDFLALSKQLEKISGSPCPPNLEDAVDCIAEARLKLSPPLASSRSEEVLRDIDLLLRHWSRSTGLTKGKHHENKHLDALILRLAQSYTKLTGRRPDLGKSFRGFVEIVVDQIPDTQRSITSEQEQISLKKRIERVLRPLRNSGNSSDHQYWSDV
jgi:hypothetical protein